MIRGFALMASLLLTFSATKLADARDTCPKGQYCTVPSPDGKCRGKCIPEDVNHSTCDQREDQCWPSVLPIRLG
jgi:hypothetical protein